MAKRLTAEEKALIRYLLDQGCSEDSVAEKVGCTERTVRRIKKETPEEDTSEISAKLKHLEYSKKDVKVQTRLLKEKIMFEDPEEGWIYDTTASAEKSRKNQFSKWWVGIVYKDSAPENWKTALKNTGLEVAISDLHDKDKWEHDNPERTVLCRDGVAIHIPEGMLYKKGDPKKAHWHIIVKTDARTAFKDMNETLNGITNGPMIQKCLSLKGSFEYLTHLNNPERYQGYDKPETFNGFTIEPNEHDKKLMLQEIMRVCQDEKLESYAELIRRYIDSPEYLNIISVKAYALKSMVDDNWKRTHQDYAKRIEVVNWWKEGE